MYNHWKRTCQNWYRKYHNWSLSCVHLCSITLISYTTSLWWSKLALKTFSNQSTSRLFCPGPYSPYQHLSKNGVFCNWAESIFFCCPEFQGKILSENSLQKLFEFYQTWNLISVAHYTNKTNIFCILKLNIANSKFLFLCSSWWQTSSWFRSLWFRYFLFKCIIVVLFGATVITRVMVSIYYGEF